MGDRFVRLSRRKYMLKGVVACKNLLGQIEGEEVPSKMLLSYEVILKESTK